ncbi:C-type lectin lectoxin-Lio1 [Pseudolycoriella hygida]|uniref:C-type lectin lectoxin-Lio1 n=1 Tax=Pseudolycoriella hygida TaxID=35572 RepID=A0A9Q0MV49_9DIPT|nr:C-type lectin lectoxin-Lio1 [Pseudolycoriella hygida]
MKQVLLYLGIVTLSFSTVYAEINNICEQGWIPLEDEKCVRLFQTFTPREQAEIICIGQGSTLISIVTPREQQILTQLILNASDAVNVWIGAQRRPGSSSEFVWNDGSAVQRFTNWAAGHPTEKIGRNCVQMRSQLSRQSADMEWVDIACTLPNWFICEKPQIWLPEHLQQAVLGLRREVRDTMYGFTDQITEMAKQLDMANTKLKYFQENPIPIGFIYVQLPYQPEPRNIWSGVEWSEVTAEYSGLFFRAEGGGSGQFGCTQAENSPRLINVNGRIATSTVMSSVEITPNGLASETLSAGASGALNHWGLSFTVSAAEVRPRNTAIRIWKRIA